MILTIICQAVMVAVSLGVLWHIVKEWRESSLPEEQEQKRLRILSMAIRKER